MAHNFALPLALHPEQRGIGQAAHARLGEFIVLPLR